MWALAPLAGMFIPVVITIPVIFAWKHWDRGRRRRSPLTAELIRLPAQFLREQLDDVTLDLMGHLMMAMFVPGYLFAASLAMAYAQGRANLATILFVYLPISVLALIWCIWKVIVVAKKRGKLRDAIDAELATAQDLEVLKAAGYRVLHDVQAGKFNIDHVVVGPSGVYAVETKSRLKPRDMPGKDAARVVFDGTALLFPDWSETKPVEQTRRQAKWLSERLAKSAGESVRVKPVLSLPGWFVERKGQSDVVVINPRNPNWIVKNASVLNEAQIQRIMFQLEQLSVVGKKEK